MTFGEIQTTNRENTSTNDDAKPTCRVMSTPSTLQGDTLVDIVIVVHLESDISERSKMILNYILTGTPDSNNKGDILFEALYQKLMRTL